jgi:hypothetical protein
MLVYFLWPRQELMSIFYERRLSSLGPCIKTSEVMFQLLLLFTVLSDILWISDDIGKQTSTDLLTAVSTIDRCRSWCKGWLGPPLTHIHTYCCSSALLAGPHSTNGKATVKWTIQSDFWLKASLTWIHCHITAGWQKVKYNR